MCRQTTRCFTDSPADLDRAAELLRAGELVAIPTETVYGLAADAENGPAVARIFEAKGRPMDNPLIVHIADWDTLPRLAAEIPDTAVKLARHTGPGPLTMIFPKGPRIPDEVSAGLPTVAVRMPSHPVARAVIRESGLSLAAPSANRSGLAQPDHRRPCAGRPGWAHCRGRGRRGVLRGCGIHRRAADGRPCPGSCVRAE